MGKLNFLGIGPKIGIVLLPWLAATIILSSIHKRLFIYSSGNSTFLLISGIVVMVVGLAFYLSTVKLLLKGLKETRLVKNGGFNNCQK